MNSNGLAGIQNKWFHGKIWENIFEVCSPESTSTGWLRLFCRSKFGRQKLLARTLAIPIIYKGLLYYLRPTTSPKSVSYIFLWCNVQAPRLDRGARNIWRVVSSPFLRLGSHTTQSCIDKYWFFRKMANFKGLWRSNHLTYIEIQEARPWTASLIQQFSNVVKFCQNALSFM